MYLTVKNWELFQHYRDRHPPWIKLHVRLLNDREFMALARASRGLLMLLWILASEDEGRVLYDEEELKFRLRLEDFSLEELNPLVAGGFLIPDEECKRMLADASICSHSVSVSISNTNNTKDNYNTKEKRFVRPSLEEVAARVAEKGYHFSPASFFSYYNSNGWRVGKNPMKSWHAACVTWEERWLADHPEVKQPPTNPGVFGSLPVVNS